jgi:hypothetical protein
VNTNPPQRCRCGKATDAGSNDSNRKVVHSVCLGRTEKVLIDILRALVSLQEPELFVMTNIVDIPGTKAPGQFSNTTRAELV